jgi:hypothetical protein
MTKGKTGDKIPRSGSYGASGFSILLGAAAVFCVGAASDPGRAILGDFWSGAEGFPTLMWVAIALMLFGFSRVVAQAQQRERQENRNRIANQIRDDARAGTRRTFSLYLRPFFTESALTVENPVRSGNVLSPSTYAEGVDADIERLLGHAMDGRAPLVAIGGDAGEAGAGRVVSDADWKDDFAALADQAEAIIVAPFAQPATAWEVSELARTDQLAKTWFLMPPAGFFKRDDGTKTSTDALWGAAQNAHASIGLALPDYEAAGGFFKADAHGHATSVTPTRGFRPAALRTLFFGAQRGKARALLTFILLASAAPFLIAYAVNEWLIYAAKTDPGRWLSSDMADIIGTSKLVVRMALLALATSFVFGFSAFWRLALGSIAIEFLFETFVYQGLFQLLPPESSAEERHGLRYVGDIFFITVLGLWIGWSWRAVCPYFLGGDIGRLVGLELILALSSAPWFLAPEIMNGLPALDFINGTAAQFAFSAAYGLALYWIIASARAKALSVK